MSIALGTKVYYKGDMANAEGFGRVTVIHSRGLVDVSMDDGRRFTRVPDVGGQFSRFQSSDQYDAERAEKLAALEAFCAKYAK